MNIKSRRYCRSGFTLLEVMIALTILGLGVVTLLQIFSMGLRLGARSAEHTTAVTSGARVMDELLARKKLVDGWQSGTLGADGRWNAQVQAVRDSQTELALSTPWTLKEVSLEVTVIEAGRERRIEFKTLRLIQKGLDEP